MDNYTIADNFSLLARLMDIHGENSFKTKSYATAAYTIEKLPAELSDMPPEKIFALKGIGDNIGKKILEQLETGRLAMLDEFVANTPAGILEMMQIKGIGPKKIATIWHDLQIETLGELLYACYENRLTLYKGFGEKTQANVKDAIEFYLHNQGSFLYAQVEEAATVLNSVLEQQFAGQHFLPTGALRRQLEIITRLEWVTDTPPEALLSFFEANGYTVVNSADTSLEVKGRENISLLFHLATGEQLYIQQFITSCSEAFLAAWIARFPFNNNKCSSEEHLFEQAGLAFIPAFQREKPDTITHYETAPVQVIQPGDVKGIIHTHSRWSDGSNTIEEMAQAAIAQGFEYLVISDHSKTAFYANGLYEERVLAQHAEIDSLNRKYAPFRIYKSIESDILNDGSLDYSNDILSTFDLVIASVHSNLRMTEEKATQRLLKAIENPYTSILGHLTGRLLLSRAGYPLDMEKILDACKANNVVIELNAHPRRLDIDWRWVDHALNKGILISIDPDAHTTTGFADIRYGVLAAQKAGVTPAVNLSSFTLPEFEAFVQQQQAKR
jgi:DNA polymerase (family 10)